VGGGKLKLGGAFEIHQAHRADFDLHLQADESRDAQRLITVRATPTSLSRPFNAASLGGTVYATHSRFFKEIDILPIALPGKPSGAEDRTQHGYWCFFPQPPLRDWKSTSPSRLGRATLPRARQSRQRRRCHRPSSSPAPASRPISRARFISSNSRPRCPSVRSASSRGFVYFTKDAPFQPSLDLQADSQARDYLVHAYIYGKASDPQVQPAASRRCNTPTLSRCSPPRHTKNSQHADVLASKAAMLAVQELYRRSSSRPKRRPSTRRNRTTAISRSFPVDLGRTRQQDRRATDHERAAPPTSFTSSATGHGRLHRTDEIPHSFSADYCETSPPHFSRLAPGVCTAAAPAQESGLERALPGAGLLAETVQAQVGSKIEITGGQAFTEKEIRDAQAEKSLRYYGEGRDPRAADDLAFLHRFLLSQGGYFESHRRLRDSRRQGAHQDQRRPALDSAPAHLHRQRVVDDQKTLTIT